jgi:hypothetical protein
MTPDAITLLFKEAKDTFPPIEGKPTNEDLLDSGDTTPDPDGDPL